jgi:NAD(P)-dependent dehydrogenase (short-subunit alcohol dehydrogenase family)
MAQSDVVVVTGAAGNVGAALCLLLAERGVRVVAVDRNEAAMRAQLADRPALTLVAQDLAEPAEGERLIGAAMQALGRIDGLAHTVGGFAAAPLGDSDAALWERMHRMNLLTTFGMIRAALPRMREAGRGGIVAIGAGAAQRAPAGLAAYAASKAGVLRLIESVADEAKAAGVRANAVLPSIIDTPQNRAAMPNADTSRWVTPRQVAEVIAYLLSDAASGVTGAAIPISGRG